MRWRPRARAVLPACLLLLAAASAVALEVPYLSGRVVDEAGMLSPQSRQQVETELAALERDTGAQVAVLTIPTLEDEALEDYSLRVAETWKLGRAEADDGVLLLIARDDRKMRLEVGYGLEPKLTDLAANRILDEVIRPRFRQGDFDGGVEAGVAAVAAVVREGEAALPEPEPATPGGDMAQAPLPARIFGLLIFVTVVGVFSLAALSSSGCQGWFLYLFLVPFWTAFPAMLLHPAAGAVTGLCWLLGYPLLRLLFHRRGRPGWLSESSGGGWSFGGGSFGGGGGGFSSGGFSGGGGSFGGGGASSGW